MRVTGETLRSADAGLCFKEPIVRAAEFSGLRLWATQTRQWGRRFAREDAASLVEVAVSAAVYLSLFFGIIQFCMALYSYNFVCDAAREASRWLAMRGANSCYPNAAFPNCNLLPTDVTSATDPTKNPVLQYIDTLNYPGLNASNLSVTPTWWLATQNGSGNTSWTTPCTGKIDTVNGNACNAEGNAVNVVVTYNFPLSIPWWKASTLKVSSTSQMVINF